MATYFEMSQSVALSISAVVVCSIVQLSFINIKSSVMLYDNMAQHIQPIQ